MPLCLKEVSSQEFSWQHFKTQVMRKLTKLIKDANDDKNRFDIIMLLFAMSVAVEHLIRQDICH